MGLPTLDWKTCDCGCGKQYLNSNKGRHRRYFNDTCKKRAYRRRIAEQAFWDAEAEETWKDCDDDTIEWYIAQSPDSQAAWLGQWELYRRAKVGSFDV